jgi:hypothetical protein
LPKPDPARVELLENTIAGVSARRVVQQDTLFERLPDLRTWRALIVPATSADLEPVLGDGDVIVQFAIDEKDLLVLVAHKSPDGVVLSAHVRPLSRRAVAEHVAAMTQPAVLQDVLEWRRAASKFVDAVLPADVLDRIVEAARVLVVPHDVLWRLPFEALPIGERYLGDVTGVIYVPSVTALVRVPVSANPIDEPVTTVAAAAPSLSETVVKRVAHTAPGWTIRNHEIAAAEVKRVLGEVPPERATSVAGADATELTLRDVLPKADVIHLGLPFRINGAGALFSPLLLAGEPAGNPPESDKDARLDARDVINMTLTARLVVLSDPSAMSMRDAADETVLVHWAWRAAGVPALMMPRWSSDATAAELLAIVHERLRAGDRPGDALRAGWQAVRRVEPRDAPYYWAGWLLIAVQ